VTAVAAVDDPFAVEDPPYAHPPGVEALRVMYERAARDLWLLPAGAEIATVRADDHALSLAITAVWCQAQDMATALNWLLLDEAPISPAGHPRAGWVPAWFAGPWPSMEPRP